LRARNLIADLTSAGVITHVNEFLGDNPDAEQSSGKKKGEEREMMLAAQAENEKLLDKDWREGMYRFCQRSRLIIEWLKRWQDDFDESDMSRFSLSSSTTPGKGKEPEK
jgi:hypothetical protein